MNPLTLWEVSKVGAGLEDEGKGEAVGRDVARAHCMEEEESHVWILVFLEASHHGVPDEGVGFANFVEHLVRVGHVAERGAAGYEVADREVGLVESCDYQLGVEGFEVV